MFMYMSMFVCVSGLPAMFPYQYIALICSFREYSFGHRISWLSCRLKCGVDRSQKDIVTLEKPVISETSDPRGRQFSPIQSTKRISQHLIMNELLHFLFVSWHCAMVDRGCFRSSSMLVPLLEGKGHV